jgi:hypothetical protein
VEQLLSKCKALAPIASGGKKKKKKKKMLIMVLLILWCDLPLQISV